VIHFDDTAGRKKASVVLVPMDDFAHGAPVEVVNYSQRDLPDVVMGRASSQLGNSTDFLNAGHFTHWCMKGFVQTGADFRNKTVGELIDMFNRDVGNNGWVYSRSIFLGLLRNAFLATGLDCSSFIDETGMSIRNRIALDGQQIVVVPDTSPKG